MTIPAVLLALACWAAVVSAQPDMLNAFVAQPCIEPTLPVQSYGAGEQGTGLADATVYNNAASNPVTETDGVYYGTGNDDMGFVAQVATVPKVGGASAIPAVNVEIGLRLAMREAAGATLTRQGPLVRIPAGKAMRIDYSVRVLPAGGGAPVPATDDYSLHNLITDSGVRFELGLDTDPLDTTAFSVFDPFSFLSRVPPGDGAMAVDHAFLQYPYSGFSGAAPYERRVGITSANPALYAANLLFSFGAQNSISPYFLRNSVTPGTVSTTPIGDRLTLNDLDWIPSSDPTNVANDAFPTGRYEVYLLMTRNGEVLSRVSLSLLQGTGPATGPITAVAPADLFGICSLGSE